MKKPAAVVTQRALICLIDGELQFPFCLLCMQQLVGFVGQGLFQILFV